MFKIFVYQIFEISNFQELHLSGRVLETGSVIPEISAQIVHEFPLSSYEVNSAVCVTRRDMSIACQLLLSGKDHSILLVKGPGEYKHN